MSDETVTTKAELVAHIDRDWRAINTLLDSLTPAQLCDIRNPDGWAVKDHIAHLTAWEQSVIAFLTGQPRHEGLGISEAVYLNEDVDTINDAIFRQRKNKPLADVQREFQQRHQELMALLAPLTDTDLMQPYSHYLPDEPGDGEGPPAMNVVYGNTANHYREHQQWIEAMLAR